MTWPAGHEVKVVARGPRWVLNQWERLPVLLWPVKIWQAPHVSLWIIFILGYSSKKRKHLERPLYNRTHVHAWDHANHYVCALFYLFEPRFWPGLWFLWLHFAVRWKGGPLFHWVLYRNGIPSGRGPDFHSLSSSWSLCVLHSITLPRSRNELAIAVGPSTAGYSTEYTSGWSRGRAGPNKSESQARQTWPEKWRKKDG